jgi:hypothetical protein
MPRNRSQELAEVPLTVASSVTARRSLSRPRAASVVREILSDVAVHARTVTDTGVDLIVMDPQFAPKVLAHRETEDFVRLIDDVALHAGAALSAGPVCNGLLQADYE